MSVECCLYFKFMNSKRQLDFVSKALSSIEIPMLKSHLEVDFSAKGEDGALGESLAAESAPDTDSDTAKPHNSH